MAQGNDDVTNLLSSATHIPMEPWEGLAAYLSGLRFPATKQAIIAKLRSRGGLDEAVATAEKIPDREYKNDEEVRAAFLKA
ncbi:hypothetical protein GCM10010211_00680 [Streptomyces albospinus]|uniref:DUF2795 domain-containing protein n=1 Tax=Streptomyces albospinus TaxID=285515 RepID=A0ABQ2UJV0_9ACTN|nr:DUF2795 domain-containing protein [Streptomyces albospinus]GGU41561.1 hypothetical protein GCM10010211_00680 [Streptomyces albospinus]